MERFELSSFYGRSLVLMLALTVFSCSGGGGCSSCEGCGIQPIAGGYPIDDRIPNAGQVRLTSSGIDFIENNIDGVLASFLPDGLAFPVPRTHIALSIDICTDNDCSAHITIESLDLQPTPENKLRAHIRANIDGRNLAGMRETWSGDCNIDLDTRAGRPFIGLVADVVLDTTSHSARRDYTRIRVENAALADGEGLEGADYDISGGFLGVCNIADLFQGTITGMIEDQVSGILNTAIGEQLCQRVGEYGCPTGTHAVPDSSPESVCRFEPRADAECVPILLGADGEGDLGGMLLGGFSPGTHAYAQFLLAAGGPGEAVNEGMTINMFGGFRGTDRTFTNTPAHHSCVPVIDPPPLPTISQLAAFRGNVIPGTTTEAHVGIGVAEAYLDYAGYGLFDSGMLCLGAGTRLSQQLSTGLVSALIMSLNDLTFPAGSSPLSIAIRPQTPPDFTIGAGTESDPLLQIALNEVHLDFYVWSTERYVRFMTFQSDLEIGVNLSVEDSQLVPEILYINAGNSSVTNSELLSERPEALAGTLETVLGTFAGSLSSGISPFDLPEIMGFQLDVPAGGVTRVSEGGSNFLGIFANLRLAGASPYTAPVETRLEVGDLSLDRESMHPDSWNQGEGNSVWLTFSALGPHAVDYEYSYRIDGGPWSAWTPHQRLRVSDDVLLLQARHEIEARARVAGEPRSVDPTPAKATLVIDILAPTLRVARTAGGVSVEAEDVITAPEQLEVRYQVDGVWTDWGRDWTLPLAHDDASVVVEVRDEAGNVGRSEAPLIRGLPNSASADCGCSAPGSGGGTPLALLGLVGVFGLALLRRRKGSSKGSKRPSFFLLSGALALSLLASGCECGDPMTQPCNGECREARGNATAGEICCESEMMCAAYDLEALCDPGYICAVSDLVVDETCGVTCADCKAKPALQPGILATHLDTVVDEDGTVFISGYSPGNPAGGNKYGDLVFGTHRSGEVTWDIVDGAPSGPITADPSGYRGGVGDPGDDVGRWTSLATSSTGYLISYYDTTHRALKLASGMPGAWVTHTVDDTGDSGRYSSLVVTPEGVPVIAYLRIQESTATPGQVESSVMVAMANLANPAGPTDWTITQVASGPMNCRAEYCESAPTCLATGQCVAATSDCSDDCGSDATCFNGSCVETIPSNYVEDMPPALGLYTSLAVDPSGGLALVYYDRSAGNIHGVRYDGASWGAPFLIDGYATGQDFVGDCGMAADVTVDSTGLWHVTYVDGSEETLRYAQVQSGAVVGSPEVVDDGSTSDGTTRFTDGRHIIGDDASIVVLEGGSVRIAYQDATAQDTVIAVRQPSGGWTITRADSEGSTGYWVSQQLLGTTSYLTTWWRARDGRTMNNGIRVLTAE